METHERTTRQLSRRRSSYCRLLLLLTLPERASALLRPPPLIDGRTLSFPEVANRAVASVEAAFADGHRRVSVEIPQISDTTSTVRKFQQDDAFLLRLVELLGGGPTPAAIGCNVEIAACGPDARSGEYLAEEGLYGYRFAGLNLRQPQAGSVTAVGNSEVGCSALRELPRLDSGRGAVLLFNLPLDRLSFFDKIGMSPLDDVEPAYQLRHAGRGAFIYREYPADFCAWRRQSDGGEPLLIGSQPGPFRPQEIDATLRAMPL
eukprot:5592924-Prymnesium_polylepis.1